MTNRIKSKFLNKLTKLILSIIVVIVPLSFYLESTTFESTVFLLVVLVPFTGIVIYNLFKNSKKETDQENKKILDLIKGE